MSANRQLKRHHACHECRTKKLKCSGDRPICDGCKRKQDHHTASGSRRPVPECTYDFPPGEEVWVHWGRPNASLATGGSVDKRTPSPPNDHKARRPRTLTKPRTEQAQSPKTIQRPVKSQESSLRPIDPPEAPPYTNPFMHVNPYNTFLPSESPYIPNDSLNPNGLSHNAALDLEYTMNEPFLDLGPHSHYFQAPATVHSPEVTINDHIYSTTSYPSSSPSFTLLSNGMYRW